MMDNKRVCSLLQKILFLFSKGVCQTNILKRQPRTKGSQGHSHRMCRNVKFMKNYLQIGNWASVWGTASFRVPVIVASHPSLLLEIQARALIQGGCDKRKRTKGTMSLKPCWVIASVKTSWHWYSYFEELMSLTWVPRGGSTTLTQTLLQQRKRMEDAT